MLKTSFKEVRTAVKLFANYKTNLDKDGAFMFTCNSQMTSGGDIFFQLKVMCDRH